MTTEELAVHDECPRKRTWTSEYLPPRVSLAEAMRDALRAGLLAGKPAAACDKFVAIASNPGLDIEAYNLYDIGIHHATLMETVCAYLLAGEGAWKPAEAVSCDGFDYEPLSYQLADGRLRRVVLCSNWNDLRRMEEVNSWRTIGDVSATNRPMLINAIVIGQSRRGFRPSPWTQAYIHPENHTVRVKRKEGKFNDSWKRVYREQTDKKPSDWLKVMQDDGAFDDLVYSVTVDVPANRNRVITDMLRIAKELSKKSMEMRRAACFKLSPCVCAKICHYLKDITPADAGWERRAV